MPSSPYGLRRRDRREVTGQLVRVLVAGPGSVAGRLPVGRHGRRPEVIAAESVVVAAFFVAAAAAVTLTPWLVVALYLAHGAKVLWQHRSQFVRGTRWWPPFCFAVDVTVASTVAGQVLLDAEFQS